MNKHADKRCDTDPLVGESKGIKLLIDGKRNQLESARLEIGFERYTKLNQEIGGYTAEYEILHAELIRACRRLAECEYKNRYRSESDCYAAEKSYNDTRKLMLDFIVRVKELEISKN